MRKFPPPPRIFTKALVCLAIITVTAFSFNSCKKESNNKAPKTTSQEIATKKKLSPYVMPIYCGDLANPCSDPACAKYYNCTPEISITPIQDGSALASFQGLNVNFSQLSSELGLTYTLSSSDIDFQNLSRSYITNDNEVGEAIVAPFKTNSSNNTTNYAFCITVDANYIYKPFIIQSVTNQYLKYFDLDEGYVLTVNNYNDINTVSYQTTTGSYMTNPSNSRIVPCGQSTMNCIIDAYSNHGFASVWAFV